jgi:hypothetical protein
MRFSIKGEGLSGTTQVLEKFKRMFGRGGKVDLSNSLAREVRKFLPIRKRQDVMFKR